jgi:transposase
MPSGRGKSKDVVVTDEELAKVEYELNRNRIVEENEKRLALLRIRQTSSTLREMCEVSQPPKQRKRKV